jgi:hypothetical protein
MGSQDTTYYGFISRCHKEYRFAIIYLGFDAFQAISSLKPV